MVAYVEYARITPKELDKVVCTACPNAYVMNYPVEYADDMYERGDYGCDDIPDELIIAGKSPDALVKPEPPEYRNADDRIERGEHAK